jgi:hypothetical protein
LLEELEKIEHDYGDMMNPDRYSDDMSFGVNEYQCPQPVNIQDLRNTVTRIQTSQDVMKNEVLKPFFRLNL